MFVYQVVVTISYILFLVYLLISLLTNRAFDDLDKLSFSVFSLHFDLSFSFINQFDQVHLYVVRK